MLSWLLSLAALCVGSGVFGFGHVAGVSGAVSGFCLAVFALSATVLIGSFEAYETGTSRRERDEG